jgi:RsiW-degrading membrane proteinase PrsW (M82 family)
MPGGLELLQSLTYRLQDPAWLQDPNNVMSLILNPIGLAGMLLLVAIVGPLVEELLKPVGLLFIPRRPGRAEAFLGGLAGASGFALAEGMFNSAANLEAWLFVVLMRVGTSLMHCLAGGLVGLGWHYLRTARRPWQAVGLYLSAAALHGVWNTAALGIGGLAFGAQLWGEAIANLSVVLLFGVIGMLALIYAVLLFGLTRWLQADLAHGTSLVSADPSGGPR